MGQAPIALGTRRSRHYRMRTVFGGATIGSLQLMLEAVQQWSDRRRQREALDLLDERLLKDAGLSRIDADREVRKSFWQA